MIARFLRASLLAVAALALSVEFAAADDPPAAKKLPTETEKSAAKLYADNCATCHQANGQGVAGSISPFAGNPAVVAPKPFDALSAVLAGIPARDGLPAMPSFGGSLDDRSVADVVNYIRTSWGNAAAPNATRSLVAAWRTSLALPVYASATARRFDCPDVGQGGGASLDPALIAALGGELSQRSVAYATLVDKYKAQNPDAGMADIVNNLVAAYCPVVVRGAGSDQAKSAALKRFALDITAYLSNQSVVGEAEPHVGIIWAVPAGYTLAERDPRLAAHVEMPAQRQFSRACKPGRPGDTDHGQARPEFVGSSRGQPSRHHVHAESQGQARGFGERTDSGLLRRRGGPFRSRRRGEERGAHALRRTGDPGAPT